MSAKKLTDLPGLTEEHVELLSKMGIKSVKELNAALNDEEVVKQIIRDFKRVGPKTVDKWKELSKSDVETKKSTETKKPVKEKEKPAKEKATKEKATKAEKEKPAKVEVVESTEKAYRVKIKPELDDETVEGLAKRAIISGRRPAFKRQEWFRYAKLGEKWRKPKGIHSKMKRRLARRAPIVDIGFRGPQSVRGLHPSGFVEVLIHNVDGLDGIDNKKCAVRIGGTVGTKKRIQIEEKADELGIRVLNRMV